LENKDARARYGVLKGRPRALARATSPLTQGDGERPASQRDCRHRRRTWDPWGPGRSLKTEQRCPAVFAAPHGRPMVYDRGDARTTE